MDTAYDLLNRLSDLRMDIYESAGCITNMLETIEEERSGLFDTKNIDIKIEGKTINDKKEELKRKQKTLTDKETGIACKKKKSGS